MKLPETFIKLDFYFQTFLIVLILATVWFGLGLFLLIPLGAWQVISALILVLGYGSRERKKYLICVFCYFLVGVYAAFYESFLNSGWVFFVFVPPILGLWYFTMTRTDHKRLKNGEDEDTQDETYDALIIKEK